MQRISPKNIVLLLQGASHNWISVKDRLKRDATTLDLVSALRIAEDASVRRMLCEILADKGSSLAVPVLLEVLADHDARVRCAAAESLGALKAFEAADALSAAIQAELDIACKEKMSAALAQLKA